MIKPNIVALKLFPKPFLSHFQPVWNLFSFLRILPRLCFRLLFTSQTSLLLHAQPLFAHFFKNHLFRMLNLVNLLNHLVRSYHHQQQ